MSEVGTTKSTSPSNHHPVRECAVDLPAGGQMLFESVQGNPDGVSYVRFENDDGEETAYWDNQEWAEDPLLVMGAICAMILNGGNSAVPVASKRGSST